MLILVHELAVATLASAYDSTMATESGLVIGRRRVGNACNKSHAQTETDKTAREALKYQRTTVLQFYSLLSRVHVRAREYSNTRLLQKSTPRVPES